MKKQKVSTLGRVEQAELSPLHTDGDGKGWRADSSTPRFSTLEKFMVAATE